jgi:arylsulfatase A-like enzyme
MLSFAKEGMAFKRAYCQAAACSPLRREIMSTAISER